MKELAKKIFIIGIHLVMLAWILYVLYEGGTLDTTSLLLHFTGLAIMGTVLIRGTAYIVKRDYENSVRKK
jgi:archaellum biogenesis protein FlaJ (TadC family)